MMTMRRLPIVFIAAAACGQPSLGEPGFASSRDAEVEDSTDAHPSDNDAGAVLDASVNDGGSPGTVDAGANDAGPPIVGGPRPTGTVSMSPTPCVGARPDQCYDVEIVCADVARLGGSIAITEPNGAAVGTVVLHKGGGGTSFLDMGFVAALESAGYRVVQLRYDSDWEHAPAIGLVAAGCRPASVFRTIAQMFENSPICLVGFSGGAGAISFAMAHYGLEDDVTYALLAAGPPFGRVDYGCAPTEYTGAPRSLCPELPTAPYAYSRGPRLDGWMGTTTCGTTSPKPSDLAMWQASSVVSDGADYDYGGTRMDWYFCAANPNETTGLADFYIDRITSPTSVACYSTECTGEQVFNNPQAFQRAVTDITARCR